MNQAARALVAFPETAVLVIGGLTVPRKMPNSRSIASMAGSGVAGPSQIDAPPPSASAAPETISGSRGPRAPTSRPARGESTTTSTPTGSRHSPAWSADMPRTSCRY